MSIKIYAIILIIVAIFSYILGSQLTPRVITKVEYQKVVDVEATKIAIARATEKLQTEFKQVKTKETTKLPNGTLKVTERTETQRDTAKEIETNKSESETHIVHEVENKITLQEPQINRFGLELFSEINTEIPKFYDILLDNKYPDLNLNAGIKFIYNATSNVSSRLKYSYEFTQKRHYVGAEIAYYINF